MLKVGENHTVCHDVLKLLTLSRGHPDARLLLAFADPDAAPRLVEVRAARKAGALDLKDSLQLALRDRAR